MPWHIVDPSTGERVPDTLVRRTRRGTWLANRRLLAETRRWLARHSEAMAECRTAEDYRRRAESADWAIRRVAALKRAKIRRVPEGSDHV